MKRMKKSIAFYFMTFSLCLLIAFSVKTRAFAAAAAVSYISSDCKDVSISLPYNSGYQYEVNLLNRKKKKIAETTCAYYASFTGATKKNQVYYYKYRKIDQYGNPAGEWSKAKPFTTIKVDRYPLKAKSKKNRTVSLKVPKIKGVKSYIISLSKNYSSGYKKVKTAKPGQRITLARYRGKKFVIGQYYYVRIQPKVGTKKAQGMVGVRSFSFIRVYR